MLDSSTIYAHRMLTEDNHRIEVVDKLCQSKTSKSGREPN
jgi:hypothetical protein